MILSWKRRRAGHLNKKKELLGDNLEVEIIIPTHFRCPISLDLMKDPVILSTGITYDRENIERWIESGNTTCPVTNQALTSFDLIPNHALRKMIQTWCVENRSLGIERIPTPRIPVAQYEVSQICSRLVEATQRGDQKKCLELVGKMKNWARESERNKRCIVENGSGCVLSSCFESFSNNSIDKNSVLLGEILSVLTWMFPLGVEGQSKLGAPVSLRCIVWFLKKSQDLSARQNAALVLKKLLSSDQSHVLALAEIEGIIAALVDLVRDPISPGTTKASLMTIYYMISHPTTNDEIRSKLVELGLVGLVLEILVGQEKGMSEKALGVLNAICDCEQGRERAYGDALVVPILVKKILRVSDLVTEIAVSVLWKLSKNEKKREDGESVLVEAIQVGAFQKLLLVLQVGCGEATKEKVTDLLKMLNLWRGKLGCSDSSMDFKYLKRPF